MRLPGVSPDRTVQFYHTLGAVVLLAAVLLSARLRRFFGLGASFGLMALTSAPVLIISTEAFYRWVDGPSHRLARRVSGWVLPIKPAAAASRS